MSEFTNAHKIGAFALLAAVALTLFDWRLGLLPVGVFLILCAIAPFMYRFSFFFPIISRGRTGRPVVALTFDDGPHPVSTPALLQLLDSHGVKATFFVMGRRAAAHPELIQEILFRGHTIGNHSYRHDPFVAFKGIQKVIDEIVPTQDLLRRLGVAPLTYRPPVGITYPALGGVLRQLGLKAVTFSCRARDRGNRSMDQLSQRILKGVRGDDIIMLHDHLPAPDGPAELFIAEVARILEGIQAKGLAVRPLEEVIGSPVHGKL